MLEIEKTEMTVGLNQSIKDEKYAMERKNDKGTLTDILNIQLIRDMQDTQLIRAYVSSPSTHESSHSTYPLSSLLVQYPISSIAN